MIEIIKIIIILINIIELRIFYIYLFEYTKIFINKQFIIFELLNNEFEVFIISH